MNPEDLMLGPSTIIVWQYGQPHPKTPWTKFSPDNPLWHPFWSWHKWGRKIVRCYLPPATPARSPRPVQQQRPVPA